LDFSKCIEWGSYIDPNIYCDRPTSITPEAIKENLD